MSIVTSGRGSPMLSTRRWLCAITLLAAASAASAAPHVTTRPAPECAGQRCALASWSDHAAHEPALITLDGVGQKPMHDYYASDEGVRSAQLVTDVNGCTYVLLEYAVGRGNGPGRIVYVAVLHVTDHLEFLRKVRLRYWLSPLVTAEYAYRIEKPIGGGLSLELTRRFTGGKGEWRYPPLSQTVRIDPPD
jgi:hypothetical protein